MVRNRMIGTVATLVVATVAADAGLTAASASGGSSDPSTAASAQSPPALPCPKTGQSVDTKSMTAPASTNGGASWAGVFERIFVTTDMQGNPKTTPHQKTFVAAAGQGSTTVAVPLSSSHLKRHSRGGEPDVVNGRAQVKLNLSRHSVQRLDSDYTRPLPVTVKVTYKLNGKSISADHIGRKIKGKVQIDYRLTNATAKPVHVCFKGFNGTLVKKTVTEPVPIYAYFSITLPKHVSQFTAPGAFLNADRKGVDPQWLVALFKPLGPAQQTLKLTMDLTKRVELPKATLLVEFVAPESLTGSAPAKSAAVVGHAQAQADAAAAKLQSDVAALELKASQPHSAKHTRGGGSKNSGGSRLSFGTSTRSLSQMQSQIGLLGNANLAFSNSVGLKTQSLIDATNRSIGRLSGSTGGSIGRMAAGTRQSITTLSAGTSRSIGDLTRRTGASIAALTATLHRAVSTPALDGITARAGQLETIAATVGTRAGSLATEVSSIAAQSQTLLSAMSTPVGDAGRLVSQFGQFGQDLNAFPPSVKATAEFVKLKADITAGQAVAQALSTALDQIQTQAQGVVDAVHTLQTDTETLQTRIATLVTATVTNATHTTQAVVDHAVNGLGARFDADVATLRQSMAGAESRARQELAYAQRSARERVLAAQRAAHNAVSAAGGHVKGRLAASLRSAHQAVTAAELKVSEIMASVRAKAQADLAAAKAKAKAGGQAALSATQASAAQVEAAVSGALASANGDYANLLGLNQQAVVWELPAGDATGVTEQEGSFIYTIAGS